MKTLIKSVLIVAILTSSNYSFSQSSENKKSPQVQMAETIALQCLKKTFELVNKMDADAKGDLAEINPPEASCALDGLGDTVGGKAMVFALTLVPYANKTAKREWASVPLREFRVLTKSINELFICKGHETPSIETLNLCLKTKSAAEITVMQKDLLLSLSAMSDKYRKHRDSFDAVDAEALYHAHCNNEIKLWVETLNAR